MKLDTALLLRKLYSQVENIFGLIDEYICDYELNKEIKRTLSKAKIENIVINDQGIKIKGDTLKDTIELNFIPSIEEFKTIEFRVVLDDTYIDKTINFEDEKVIIAENQRLLSNLEDTLITKRVYDRGELKYSYSELSKKVKEGTAKRIIECFIDGITLKSREAIIAPDSEVKIKYNKKTLEKPIPYKNKKEKIKFNPANLSKLDLDISKQSEVEKYIEYWKEINAITVVEDRTLSKTPETNE